MRQLFNVLLLNALLFVFCGISAQYVRIHFRFTSALHAHALNAFIPYHNTGSAMQEVHEEKPRRQAVGTGGVMQSGILPAD